MNVHLNYFSTIPSLMGRLEHIHQSLLLKLPSLDRIAVALYDPKTDLLRTFINSTLEGQPITTYEYYLADCPSLQELADSRDCRVIDNIQRDIKPHSEHSRWLLEQKYSSSFTVPMVSGDKLLGFIFFDSYETAAFQPEQQRNLLLFSNLIIMTVSSEIFAVNSLLATVAVAREFAHLRDFETGMHLDRIAKFSRLVGQEVAEHYQLTDQFVEYVYLFAALHDIGKIGIPDEILLKPAALDERERKIMETHVQKGVDILNQVLADYDIAHLSDSQIMVNIIACHHEFLDGSGYPNKLKGDAIPIEARIVTVVDIFDALTSVRPYKNAWSTEDALNELERMAKKGKLDPICVQALRKHEQQAAEIVVEMCDVFDQQEGNTAG